MAYKDGYTFVGWNTDSNAKEGLDNYQMPASNTTLYAIFRKTITVTYEIGEGIESISKNPDTCHIYNNDKSCEITLPELTISDGYSIDGFYLNNEKIGSPNDIYNVSSDITLTAQTLNIYTVTYNYNGSHNYYSQSGYSLTMTGFDGTENQTHRIGKIDMSGLKFNDKLRLTMTVNYENITDIGDGFRPQAYGNVTVWNPGFQWKREYDSHNGLYEFSDITTLYSEKLFNNEFMYLQIRTDYMIGGTLTFSNIKIEKVTETTAEITEGNTLGELPVVSDNGYTFDGWYTDPVGGTKITSDTVVDGNVTYYAHWIDNIAPEVPTYEAYFSSDNTPYASGTWTSKEVYTRLTSSDSGSGVKSIQISYDDGEHWQDLTLNISGGLEITGTTAVGIESWRYENRNETTYFRAVDNAGNISGMSKLFNIKYDLDNPGLNLSSSSTTSTITVSASASATSGISTYEYRINNGNWVTGNSNMYTFTNLNQNTSYNIEVRVTSGSGLTSTQTTTVTTKEIPMPTFSESETSTGKNVTITYPSGCGSTYTCSYIKDGESAVTVTSTIATVEFTTSGTLIATVSDNINEVYNTYNIEIIATLQSWSQGATTDFHSSTYKSKITSAEVVDYKDVPSNAVASWDVSADKNSSIMAWVIDDPENSGYYKLYIGGDGGVKASTSLANIFYGTFSNSFRALETIDLTKLDTSNVIDMSNMFNNCGNLTTLDVSNFDTSNVTDMSYMFYYCSSLPALDVSNFDTSNVTTMSYMFSDCSSLPILDVSNFDTSNVTNMMSMFSSCSSLPALDVSNFDTSNVTTMSYMFAGCRGFTTLNVSNFDTSNVTNMSWMFFSCNSFTTLDLSSFETSNVTDMSNMFSYASNLTTIYVGSGWTTENASTINMFSQCGTHQFTVI